MNILTKKISSAVAAIRNVSFLPRTALTVLYYCLVESRLRYCNTLWGYCGSTLLNKFLLLQNRCACTVTRIKYGSVDLEALLKELGSLNVQQLIDFDTIVMVHKSMNGNAPTYLSKLFTKSKDIYSHYTRSAEVRRFHLILILQKSFAHH